MGFWVFGSSFFALCLGFFLVPYWPNACVRSDLSFFDVASIDQSDRLLMERGIYGIAGFLSISQELRILWSGPHFSRLWCVFELAAYKKVNPEGMISFKPLFVEKIICWIILGGYFMNMLLLFYRSTDAKQALFSTGAYAIFLVGVIGAVWMLRANFRQKHQLILDLKQFDLEKVHCANAFDRAFILKAIKKWYGSHEAFVQYVREDLQQELMKTLDVNSIPANYALLVLLPTLAVSCEFFIALWMGGVPAKGLWAFAICIFIGMDVLWMYGNFWLMVELSDRLAQRRFGVWDPVQTAFIVCVVGGVWILGVHYSIYAYTRGGIVGAIAFTFASLVFAGMAVACQRMKRRFAQTQAAKTAAKSEAVPKQVEENVEETFSI